jgi:hypothetical protein
MSKRKLEAGEQRMEEQGVGVWPALHDQSMSTCDRLRGVGSDEVGPKPVDHVIFVHLA